MQIVVLGMHRAGTSAVTGLLVKMGAYFGAQNAAMPANFANPAGFWERLDVVRMNDELLAASGAAWNAPLDYDTRKIPPAARASLDDRMRAIAGELSANAFSVVKDPRMCLTADAWLPLFPKPVCLLVFRNPLAIARSLERRGDCSVATGLALWELSTRSSLRASRNHPTITLDYDRLMADAPARLGRLVRELEAIGPTSTLGMPAQEDITNALFADMQHHIPTRAEFAEYATPAQLALFDQTCSVLPKDIADAPVSVASRDALRYFAERELPARGDLQGALQKMALLKDEAAALTQSREHLRGKISSIMAELEAAEHVLRGLVATGGVRRALWLARAIHRRGVTSADVLATIRRLSAAWAVGRETLDNHGKQP